MSFAPSKTFPYEVHRAGTVKRGEVSVRPTRRRPVYYWYPRLHLVPGDVVVIQRKSPPTPGSAREDGPVLRRERGARSTPVGTPDPTEEDQDRGDESDDGGESDREAEPVGECGEEDGDEDSDHGLLLVW